MLALADVLDHADRRDRVVALAVQVAVVGDAHLDLVAQPGFGDPPAGQFGLGWTQCDADGLHAVFSRGVDHERAPAAADVEHALALFQLELLADEVELRELRLLKRLRPAREDRAAVGHRLVEKQFEELVGDVVVVAHRPGVAFLAVAAPLQPQLPLGRARGERQSAGPAAPRPRGAHAWPGRSRAPRSRRSARSHGRGRRPPARRRHKPGRARARQVRARRGRPPWASAP